MLFRPLEKARGKAHGEWDVMARIHFVVASRLCTLSLLLNASDLPLPYSLRCNLMLAKHLQMCSGVPRRASHHGVLVQMAGACLEALRLT